MRESICSPVLVQDSAGWLPMPVCPLEKVDGMDPDDLFRLAHLPLLATIVTFELSAETHLVGEGFV
jgi:hypothetical protein